MLLFLILFMRWSHPTNHHCFFTDHMFTSKNTYRKHNIINHFWSWNQAKKYTKKPAQNCVFPPSFLSFHTNKFQIFAAQSATKNHSIARNSRFPKCCEESSIVTCGQPARLASSQLAMWKLQVSSEPLSETETGISFSRSLVLEVRVVEVHLVSFPSNWGGLMVLMWPWNFFFVTGYTRWGPPKLRKSGFIPSYTHWQP